VALLISSAILPNNVRAEDVCFSETTAKRIVADLSYYHKLETQLGALKEEFLAEREAFDNARDNLNQQVELYKAQSEAEHKRAEAYRTEWKECTKALTKCEQSKPSRLVWYSAGAGSAMALVLVIALL